MSVTQWVWLALALVFAAITYWLMTIEAALSTMTSARVEQMLEESKPGSQALKDIVDDPAPTATGATTLRIVFEVSASVIILALIFSLIDTTWVRIAVAILVLSVLSFTLWWAAPRTIGRLHDEKIALRWARPISVISTIVWPFSQLMIWVTNALTPGPGWTDGPLSPEAEKIAVASDGEREMIRSVFELGDTLVREVMVPRTDIVFLEAEKTTKQGLSLALRSGFSRIPVVGEDIDDIVGILFVKDAMQQVYAGHGEQPVKDVMRQATFVPDSKPIDELLSDMQVKRTHLVVVIDEFGGTSGLATIEDLVEEIVGEITDEFDAEPSLAQEISPGLWRVSSRMPVDDVGELFGLTVDDEEVETIGGLLAKELNMVPIPGAQVVWNGLEITAERATARRHQIDTVVVRHAEPNGQDGEDEVE